MPPQLLHLPHLPFTCTEARGPARSTQGRVRPPAAPSLAFKSPVTTGVTAKANTQTEGDGPQPELTRHWSCYHDPNSDNSHREPASPVYTAVKATTAILQTGILRRRVEGRQTMHLERAALGL